jgi:hypothetical protein
MSSHSTYIRVLLHNLLVLANSKREASALMLQSKRLLVTLMQKWFDPETTATVPWRFPHNIKATCSLAASFKFDSASLWQLVEETAE